MMVVAYHLDFDGYRYLKSYGPQLFDLLGGETQVHWRLDLRLLPRKSPSGASISLSIPR